MFYGENAQGKSNLLEAIYLLALTRSPAAETEKELIHWEMAGAEAWARVEGQLETATGPLRVEIFLRLLREGVTEKRLWVNGLPRRAFQVVGLVSAVMFKADDIGLIGGPPSRHRQFLDVAACQVSSRYLRTWQHYQRVLTQRNHLLRRIAENLSQRTELEFWDQELVTSGCYIIAQRQELVGQLQGLAQEIHSRLTPGGGSLVLEYHSTPQEAMPQSFQQALKASAERELALGATQVGPHRDELRFWLGGRDMGSYGSRGQRRTIALALKLAEGEYLRQGKGEPPILLLDDALSELDGQRQHQLWEYLKGYQQFLLTTSAPLSLEPAFRDGVARFLIKEGTVTPG